MPTMSMQTGMAMCIVGLTREAGSRERGMAGRVTGSGPSPNQTNRNRILQRASHRSVRIVSLHQSQVLVIAASPETSNWTAATTTDRVGASGPIAIIGRAAVVGAGEAVAVVSFALLTADKDDDTFHGR